MIFKDEKYFETFKRNLLVTAITHSSEEVHAHHMPGHDEDSQEYFQQKQYLMYCVFNKVLQSDTGKTIVRRHAPTWDAQSLWWEFESHMSTSSKGLNETCRIDAYVSTTVFDGSWKGTTEQFVLHFKKQFRQLEELTPLDGKLPHSVRLTLLQTAVRSVPELRIVETMEEYMTLRNSYTSDYFITYDTYFTMLQNACIRYDKSLKQESSLTAQSSLSAGT